MLRLMIDGDKNLRETRVNVNSRFTIFGNCELQFSLFLRFLVQNSQNIV